MDSDPDRWTLPDWATTLAWCQIRNSQGIRCIIDVLGEYASTKEATDHSMAAYMDCINQIRQNNLRASISIKLSALGATFDEELVMKNALALAKEALREGVGLEIDMEGKQSVDLTVRVVKTCAMSGIPVTMALQAYLKRSLNDLESLQGNNIQIRLVKGAYVGDFSDVQTINKCYLFLLELLSNMNLPICLATHDMEILDWMRTSGIIETSKTEFSFLKGLADKTKLDLVKKGRAVSEYVPFGKESGPYIARRMKYLHDLEVLKKSPAP